MDSKEKEQVAIELLASRDRQLKVQRVEWDAKAISTAGCKEPSLWLYEMERLDDAATEDWLTEGGWKQDEIGWRELFTSLRHTFMPVGDPDPVPISYRQLLAQQDGGGFGEGTQVPVVAIINNRLYDHYIPAIRFPDPDATDRSERHASKHTYYVPVKVYEQATT